MVTRDMESQKAMMFSVWDRPSRAWAGMAWAGEDKASEADVTAVQFFRTGKVKSGTGRTH